MTANGPAPCKGQAITVRPRPDGHAILLDNRPMQTPLGHDLLVPTAALARLIASEWPGAERPPDPAAWLMTRLAHTALDLPRSSREAMMDSLLAYLASDVICYRAADPPDLVGRQRNAWDPILARYGRDWGMTCTVTTGIMPINQPKALRDAMRARFVPMNNFILVALKEQVVLTTSLLLAMAQWQGWITPEETWQCSQIDIDWQRERWGADDEDGSRLTAMHGQFLQATAFLTACTPANGSSS